MNYSPSLPTDNLHKFMAACGLFLTIACLAYFAYLELLLYKSEKEVTELTNYTFSVEKKKEIDNRIKYLLTDGKIQNNRLEWLPKNFSKNEELNFLREASKNHEEAISHYKNTPHESLDRLRDIYSLTYWIIVFISLLGSTLLILGFSRWHKHQRRRDQLDEMEIELKNAIIKKTQLEIKKLSKPSYIKRS